MKSGISVFFREMSGGGNGAECFCSFLDLAVMQVVTGGIQDELDRIDLRGSDATVHQ